MGKKREKRKRNPLASNVKGIFDLICRSFSPDQIDELMRRLKALDK